MKRLLFVLMLVAILLAGTAQAGRDITGPLDEVKGVPDDGLEDGGDDSGWPPNEVPRHATDDQVLTKYLHFKGNFEPTGFRTTPVSDPAVVTELTFTTANDAEPRDPVKWEFYGSNDSIDGPFTLIASGDIVDFSQATVWPRRTKNTTPITFANDTAYKHYQIMFPEIRDAGSANSMQIAEVELLAEVLQASAPNPVDGADDVLMPLFRWVSGDTAVFEDIYIGTTPELTAADRVGAHQPAALSLFYYAMGLTSGQTYYWRVDAITLDGTVIAGETWSFMAAPLTAYGPDPRDGDKWISVATNLAWRPGQGATSHAVYFGTDQAAVEARDAGTFLGDTVAPQYELTSLEEQTTYYWAVDESGAADHPGPVWTFTTEGGTGGLKGEYFMGTTPGGMPVLTRIDEVVNFNWAAEGPGAPLPSNGWSARWTADLDIAVADTFTFTVTSEGGTRLWIDEELVLDHWVSWVPTTYSTIPQYLEAGIHSLRLEFADWNRNAQQELYWSTPTMPQEIIPAGPLQPPLRARALYPQDLDVDIPQDVTMVWSAGEKAATHEIYFGEDMDAVAGATPDTAGIYRGSQAADEATYSPGMLEWNKTYYWRVDEVNDVESTSPWTSGVWSFTTADFLVVDNFEGYTDDMDAGEAIFQTWIDGLDTGNGSTVGYLEADSGTFGETVVVHSGVQAMPFEYSNVDSPWYSEAYNDFAIARDWTVNELSDLVIWFRGNPVGFLETASGITMSASGTDIWDTIDEFRYAYKPLNGNGSITARVDSVVNTDNWAKAGVMIRESLDPGSKHAYVVVTPGSGVSFGWRVLTNDTSSSINVGGLQAPQYVKLTREGNNFTAQYSANGTTWTDVTNSDGTVATTSIMMAGSPMIGLALTSHDSADVTSAEFADISVTGAVGAWQVADIGVDHPGNSQESLYAVLEDSTGTQATVVNPDPEAVLTTTWTEWRIPLSDFAGVNASRVKRIYIGVGDRDNPKPGGTGRIYVDDIRVMKPAE